MTGTEQQPWICPVCGTDDAEILDAKDCVQCRRLACICCIHWVGEDHDEPEGDWFCHDCIEWTIDGDE